MKVNVGKMLLLVLLFSLFTVLWTKEMVKEGMYNRLAQEGVTASEYRRTFFSDVMKKQQQQYAKDGQAFLKQVEDDIKYFPIPESTREQSLTVSYVDSWMGERNYKGKSGHEGTDIMASKNDRGRYPIISMTDGVVTNLGWLEKGGYRIGITAPSGAYYYYAHLDSYADIKEGSSVKAGTLLGFMGDSGYGKEGTVGQFDVHLHLGIYSFDTGMEVSVNPYYVLRFLEKHKLKYAYS